MRPIATLLAGLLLLCTPLFAWSQDDPVRDALLGKAGDGTMSDGIEAIASHLQNHPDDDRARLALGLMTIVRTGESTSQFLWTHGAGNPTRTAGAFVFPMVGAIPGNPEPELLTLEMLDGFMRTWMAELDTAAEILGAIDDDSVALEVDLAQLRFDLNGNGIASDNERAGVAMNILFTGGRRAQEDVPSFVVRADMADVHWLIAYTHVFRAAGEFYLAHDVSNLLHRAGHVIFPNTETPYDFLRGSAPFDDITPGVDITDLIVFFHSLRFPVDEPERMESVRRHLLQTIQHSRHMWDHALSETDDDREWIPNPNQEGVLRGMDITQERVELWHDLLEETEAALKGEKLVRFWRGDSSRGINLVRVFQEPREFDLWLWMQGTAAAPYLEEGEFTRDFLWRDFEEAFGENPFRYIFYVN